MKHVAITDHAKERLAERTTISPKNYQWYVDEAFKNGSDYSEFKGDLKIYIEKLCHDQGQFIAKIYGKRIYIFNNDHGHRLLTLYDIPEEYSNLDKYKIHANEYITDCRIRLTEKKSGKEYYWSQYNRLTTDPEEMREFKNQISANKYIHNNYSLDYYLDDYILEVV